MILPFRFWDKSILEEYFNNMADDALAPCIAVSRAAVLLNVYDTQAIHFHEEEFQLLAPTQCQYILHESSETFSS